MLTTDHRSPSTMTKGIEKFLLTSLREGAKSMVITILPEIVAIHDRPQLWNLVINCTRHL